MLKKPIKILIVNYHWNLHEVKYLAMQMECDDAIAKMKETTKTNIELKSINQLF